MCVGGWVWCGVAGGRDGRTPENEEHEWGGEGWTGPTRYDENKGEGNVRRK